MPKPETLFAHFLDRKDVMDFFLLLLDLLIQCFCFGSLGSEYERTNEMTSRSTTILIFCLIGVLCGLLSAIFSPIFLISSPILRILNLIFTPLVVGQVGVFSARYFYRDHTDVDPADLFLPGALFSLAVVLSRLCYICAN